MALQGDLADLPLIDLMQVLTIQRRSGILTLVQNFSQAQVAFTQSRIYSAFVWEVNSRGREIQCDGVPALHELMDWKDGQFTFELTNFLPPTENVKVPFEVFVKEHYSLTEKQNLLDEVTNWDELCPELVEHPPANANNAKLPMDELRVLRLINGILNVKDIAETLLFDVPQVIGIVRELDRRGLISFPRRNQPLALPGTYLEYRQNVEASRTLPPAAQNRGAETVVTKPAPLVKPLSIEAKPGDIIEVQAEPAAIKPAVRKLAPDFPSFDTIESVLNALPMGPAWMGPSNGQQPPAQIQPQASATFGGFPDPFQSFMPQPQAQPQVQQPQPKPQVQPQPQAQVQAQVQPQPQMQVQPQPQMQAQPQVQPQPKPRPMSPFEEGQNLLDSYMPQAQAQRASNAGEPRATFEEKLPVAAWKSEPGQPSLDFFNMPIETDGPITTPSQWGNPAGERFVPSTAASKTPSRLQAAPIQWDEKKAVEDTLRPKVKRSLLGTIMAKIRGL